MGLGKGPSGDATTLTNNNGPYPLKPAGIVSVVGGWRACVQKWFQGPAYGSSNKQSGGFKAFLHVITDGGCSYRGGWNGGKRKGRLVSSANESFQFPHEMNALRSIHTL